MNFSLVADIVLGVIGCLSLLFAIVVVNDREVGAAWLFTIVGVVLLLIGGFATPAVAIASGILVVLTIAGVVSTAVWGDELDRIWTERKRRRIQQKPPHEVYPQILDWRSDDVMKGSSDRYCGTLVSVTEDHTVRIKKINGDIESMPLQQFMAFGHNASLKARKASRDNTNEYWTTLQEQGAIRDEARRMTAQDFQGANN
jgi:hypothetical protein